VYGEPANVQARDDGRPARFVWRGRLYTVRAILEHWVINREWWQEPRAQPSQSRPGQPQPGQPQPGQPQPGQPQPGPAQPARPELEFWRVEASPGPGLTAEIYDLRRDATGAWTLRSQTGH
jgi:Family of unknown function (DUF6504)